MERFSKKKFAVVIVFALIMVLGTGAFLMYMQNRLALANQRNDLKQEIEQVSEVVSGLDAEVAEEKANFDEIYYSKAQTIAYMIQKTADFTMSNEKMAEFTELFHVDNVLVLNADGTIVAEAKDAEADFTASRFNQLRTCLPPMSLQRHSAL